MNPRVIQSALKYNFWRESYRYRRPVPAAAPFCYLPGIFIPLMPHLCHSKSERTHRDLKPGNVLLTSGGAKLLDFGLAKLNQLVQSPRPISGPVTVAESTAPGMILGTVPYMAP